MTRKIMQRSTTKRIVFNTALAGLAVGALSGCGDSRIKQLTPGISRDSALKVVNEGAAGDSLARVYKQETYLVDGQQLNVLFYNKDGIKQASDSTLAADAQTPIVTVNGKVTGWGWTHYDSVAKANNITPAAHP
jgi:hypothetical protein